MPKTFKSDTRAMAKKLNYKKQPRNILPQKKATSILNKLGYIFLSIRQSKLTHQCIHIDDYMKFRHCQRIQSAAHLKTRPQ